MIIYIYIYYDFTNSWGLFQSQFSFNQVNQLPTVLALPRNLCEFWGSVDLELSTNIGGYHMV